MRYWFSLLILVIFCPLALAQDVNINIQQQADRLQLQQLQQELETSRMQAQTESMQRNTARMLTEIQQMDSESKQSKPESMFEIMARHNAQREAERKAQEAISIVEENKQIEAAKQADMAYMFVVIAMPLIFGFYLANKVKKGMLMKHEEKFGVLLIVASALSGIAAIVISDGWVAHMDVLQNLMLTLRFRLLPDGDSIYSPATIDFPTKYVLLFLVTVAAYGFTTYLGITPALKKTDGPSTPSETNGGA